MALRIGEGELLRVHVDVDGWNHDNQRIPLISVIVESKLPNVGFEAQQHLLYLGMGFVLEDGWDVTVE